MMLVRVLLAAAVFSGITHGALAQAQPGPEHKRLEYLIGQWKVDATGLGGKLTGTTSCEWFDGRFQVMCRSDLIIGGASIKQLEIFAYDATERGYTRYFVSSEGSAALSKGQVSGKTWTWGPMVRKGEGAVTTINATVTEVSPDSWTSKITVVTDGGPAQIVSEGTTTRIK